jgi:hypothetical protein
MYRLLILGFLLIFIFSGCLRHNNCYEQCYATMKVMPHLASGQVEHFLLEGDLEQAKKERFSDCIVVGKSHFSGPPVPLKSVKRFAAKKGANIILWRGTPERAGLEHECRCNPIGSHHVEIVEAPGENETLVVSASASAGGSAAVGPGATVIYAHRIWFLYRDEQKQ